MVEPISGPFRGSITPPGSKSLTNRALILAALADGTSELSNVLFADDTRVMLDCLSKLGFEVHADPELETARVTGHGGKIPRSSAELFCGNSGTTIRFLTALCSLGRGTFTSRWHSQNAGAPDRRSRRPAQESWRDELSTAGVTASRR